MDMEQKNSMGWWGARRSFLLAGAGLAVASGLLAINVGSARVDLQEQAVLRECQSSASAWLEGTAAAVTHWQDEMKEIRLRISESETYRLFAGDMSGLDKDTVSRISEGTEWHFAYRGMLQGKLYR
jgi:hypothetical protein